MAAHAALTVLSVLLRITWRSVAAIVIRVVAEADGKRDRLAGLRRIGIDEISYQLTHVSCDGAEWIHDVVAERAPQAALWSTPLAMPAPSSSRSSGPDRSSRGGSMT